MRITSKILTSLLCLPLLVAGCNSANPYDEIEKDPAYDGGNSRISGKILDDNTIEVNSKNSGIYTLMYEGTDGQVLPDYSSICTLTMKGVAYYDDFIGVNVAPESASEIGIFDFDGKRQGKIDLGSFKPDFTETPAYSFGVLSDVHIGKSGINAESDFTNALNFFNSQNVVMTCICGDITQDGTEAQFSKYQQLQAQSKTPVYTTTGNHDCTRNAINPATWEKYTGQPLVFEKSVQIDGKTDHFLFLGMSDWDFTAAYLDEHIAWLGSRLEEYKNERCFVITHLFFPDRAGNLNDIYPSGNWLKGAQFENLKKLCDTYHNSIWFSGHSHWEWQLQKYQDRANIYREYKGTEPASGWCVHIPACGCPITSDGSSRDNNESGSEGALIKVYKNHVDVLGLDLKAGKYLPIATYRLS
jgi:hypothetical protein